MVKWIYVDSLNSLINKLREKRPKRIILQGPDGYRNRLLAIYETILSELGDVEIFIDGERSFGGCDITTYTLNYFNKIDAIVHVGHTQYQLNIKFNVPIYYLPLYDDISVNKRELRNLLEIIAGKKVVLLYSLQFKKICLEILDMLREHIKEYNFNVVYYGQLIGCDKNIVKRLRGKADIIVIIGSGRFHGLGIYIWTGIKTLVFDVYRNKIIDLDRDRKRILSLIADRIDKTANSKKIGIIITVKSGQYHYEIAKKIKKELEKRNKKAYLILMQEITPEKLKYFLDIDAFIQTGCPRISIDDIDNFDKPIINVEQFLILTRALNFDEVYPDEK